MKPVLILSLLIISSICCFSHPNEVIIFNELQPENNSDTVPGKRGFGTLKINPFQILASEIPVSFEIYLTIKSSIQLQIGYIFPMPEVARVLEQTGDGGSVITEGLLNYRTLPYNNDAGLNFKVEYRKYSKAIYNKGSSSYKSFYYAPQLMYKYCYYDHRTFTFFTGQVPYYKIESKNSNIVGFGFIIGSQKCSQRLVTDWYAGIGLRIRGIKSIVHEVYYSSPSQAHTYPDRSETDNSVYPFINFGLRFGFGL